MTVNKIGIASDHAGYRLKLHLMKKFKEIGLEIVDFGCYSADSCDYPDYAHPMAESLSKNEVGGYITGKDLHKMLREEMQVKCSLRTIYNALHRLNFSWITARSKHQHSDHARQEEYKKTSVN